MNATALRIRFIRFAQVALLLMASANLYAESNMSMAVPLTGDAEVPPVMTSATGTVKISVMADRTVSGKVKVSGLTATAVHIHEAPAGANGPPIITLSKSDDGFVVPADAMLTEAQFTSYMAGNLYVNVHSAKHPDGELRAQLPPP